MVDAPNLEYLGVSQCCLVQYCLKSYPSLVKADITLLPNSRLALGRIPCGNGVDGLLKAVSNVERLFLNAFDVEALDLAMDNKWPVFPNLVDLEMWFPHGFGGKSFSDLLNGVPNLHTLHIFNHTYGPLVFNWFEPTEKPRFLQFCLREVEFRGIQGLRGELMMIEYFLGNVEILERMAISHKLCDTVKENDFLKELHKFPRCSKTCKIEFVG